MSFDEDVERLIGIAFADKALLTRALTHSSYIHENPEDSAGSNERLEFLGDAVLGLVIADDLYDHVHTLTAGEMTTLRAQLVSTNALAQAALRLGLGNHIRFGKGEEMSGGRVKPRNLAGAMEAVIGALWLDAGLQAAGDFIVHSLKSILDPTPEPVDETDYKSRLQEMTQATLQAQPRYETVSQMPKTGDPTFAAKVIVAGKILGEGAGPSKREAQREAARKALEQFSASEMKSTS